MIDTELLIISVDIALLLITGCVIIFGMLDPIERPDMTQMFYSTRQYAYCTLKGLRDLPYTFGVHNISKKCKRWRRGKSHFITMSPREVNCLANEDYHDNKKASNKGDETFLIWNTRSYLKSIKELSGTLMVAMTTSIGKTR